jgi:hypothetical protein
MHFGLCSNVSLDIIKAERIERRITFGSFFQGVTHTTMSTAVQTLTQVKPLIGVIAIVV